MIIPENLFTNLTADQQDDFITFLPWVEATVDMDMKEIERRYHMAAKTFLSYEGMDI